MALFLVNSKTANILWLEEEPKIHQSSNVPDSNVEKSLKDSVTEIPNSHP